MAAPRVKHDSADRERRQLTVMFCDLVNSTGLQRVVSDEDDYWDMVEDYFECCRQHIGRFGGEVQRYEGDGLLAYFGFPTADELATQSAVRAALKIVVDVPRIKVAGAVILQTRIGIATGMVTVGKTRDDGKAGENAAQGLAPPLAARLLKLAEPGGIVVSRTTHDMVRSLFDFESLGVRRLAGIEEPQQAWLVTGDLEIESHSEAIHLARDVTPYVGREQEIRTLADRWQSVRSGKGHAVVIRGEAGIGKSRIIRSVLEMLQDESLGLLHLYGVQYFKHSALYPVAKQLNRDARIRDEDTTAERHEKLRHTIAQQQGDADRYLPWFCKLLSLPVPDGLPQDTASPERQQELIVEALIDRVLAMSARRPLMMVFEDLHWVDQASIALLNRLIERIAEHPVLILMTDRQSVEPQLRASPNLSELMLNKLDRENRRALVMEMTGHKALPPAVLEHIVEKTDGIPLYIEEFTKSVLESGVLMESSDAYEMTGSLQSLNLPNSLNDSLMARLDRLSADPDSAKRYKEIAQTCAAIGRDFSFDLISAVTAYGEEDLKSALRHLEEAELIFPLSRRLKLEYSFKHALVQEEAYRSIVKRSRKRLHIRIAEVLERRFPATCTNEPELVAHHYTQGDLAANAVPYWILAGEQAGQRAAHTQAVANLQSALRLIGDLPETKARNELELNAQVLLGLSLAASQGYGIPEVLAAYERARSLCRQIEDFQEEKFSVIQSGLVTFYILRAQYDIAVALSQQFVDNAERPGAEVRDGDRPITNYHIDAYRCLGISQLFTVELEESRNSLERCTRLFEQSRSQNLIFVTPENPAVAALSVLPLTLWLLGRPDEAVRRKEQGLALAEELGHPFNIAFVHVWSAALHQWRREPERAAEHARAAVGICDDHGFDAWGRAAKVHLSIALGAMSETETALALFESVRPILENSGTVCFTSYFVSGVAETLRVAGMFDQALELIAAALKIASDHDERFYKAEIYRQRGITRLAQADGNAEEGERDLVEAIELARQQNAKSLQLRALNSLCRWHRDQGREVERLAELRELYLEFAEGFDTRDLQEAQALLNG